VLALALLAYAWMASGLQPFTLPSLVTVVGGGVAAMVLGSHVALRPATGPLTTPGRAWLWAALASAISAWELQSFLQHPRHDHPTLSSLTNTLLASHSARAVALVAWLATAVWLARR